MPKGNPVSNAKAVKISQHQYDKDCDGVNCGGTCAKCCLSYCVVCKCGEGELASHCPGFALDEFVRTAIYKGGLDFYNGEWQVKYCPYGKAMRGEAVCFCAECRKNN